MIVIIADHFWEPVELIMLFVLLQRHCQARALWKPGYKVKGELGTWHFSSTSMDASFCDADHYNNTKSIIDSMPLSGTSVLETRLYKVSKRRAQNMVFF